jgi:hypothetical protein
MLRRRQEEGGLIRYVVTERFSSTMRGLIAGLAGEAHGLLGYLTYEELFLEQAGPVGHYIFTDFDRLSRYERDCAGAFAVALARAAPEVRILNHPAEACERLPLLRRLAEAGFNDFDAVRLDEGGRPSRFPVFIRAEDGYGGIDSEILADAAAFEAALAGLRRQGLPLKGRIAVGYVGEPGADGFHRKYGAFNIGGAIVPQHLMCGDRWVVKKASSRIGPDQVAEELAYVRDNPHSARLLEAFAIGGLGFGRVDYGFFAGRLQVYEINTNPSFPNFSRRDARSERRELIRRRFLDALRALDSPHGRGRVRFQEARPRAHDRRLPRRRFLASMGRLLRDRLAAR